MPLLTLPVEILEQVVEYTIPEGLESFALSCKDAYGLCKQFLPMHNQYRRHFRSFSYGWDKYNPRHLVGSAYSLIARIAACPVVGLYIRKADLSRDSTRVSSVTPAEREAATGLLNCSSILQEAGLDPREFQAEMDEQQKAFRYSQNAAILLLSLLPNVEQVSLPKHWVPTDVTTIKLLKIMVRRTNASTPTQRKFGLAKTRTLEACPTFAASRDPYPLDCITPFLSLPRLESFRGIGCVPAQEENPLFMVENPRLPTSTCLTSVSLTNANLHGRHLVELLRELPHVREFCYTRDRDCNAFNDDWDACEVISAIEDDMAGRLDILQVHWWPMETL